MATHNFSEPASLEGRIDDRLTWPSENKSVLETLLSNLQSLEVKILQAEQLLREAKRYVVEVRAAWQAQLATMERQAFQEEPAAPLVANTPTQVPSTDRAADDLVTASAHGGSLPGPAIIPLQTHPRYLSSSSPSLSEAGPASTLPPLYITCFGRFTVRRRDAEGPLVELCHNTKGQAILRYLLAQPQQQASVDTLMAELWSEEEREASRHKLQIAVSALRASLNGEQPQPGGGYILYKGQSYLLNPAVSFWTDVSAFRRLFAAGNQTRDQVERARCYEEACKLYRGPFLVEDLYAEWSFLPREELAQTYRRMCAWLADYELQEGRSETALAWIRLLLTLDRFDEEAYRKLMRAHGVSGRRSEVVRCYEQCRQLLREELGIEPLPETQQLFEEIMKISHLSPATTSTMRERS